MCWASRACAREDGAKLSVVGKGRGQRMVAHVTGAEGERWAAASTDPSALTFVKI